MIMEERHVVTCFLEHGGEIPLLRRSQRVGTYKGRWAGVSGYIEEGNTPYAQAMEEIREETGLSEQDVQLVKEGQPLEVVDEEMDRPPLSLSDCGARQDQDRLGAYRDEMGRPQGHCRL